MHDVQVYRPRLCTPADMKKFHSDDYVDFLERITPENQVNVHSNRALDMPVLVRALYKKTMAPDLLEVRRAFTLVR